MEFVYLGLGSNIGDREKYLSDAINEIRLTIGVVEKCSSIIETPSWGFDSSPFLNQVILIQTDSTPEILLTQLQEIEKKLGRKTKTIYQGKNIIYSDRPIDIDILIYGVSKVKNALITIPHPKMFERDFVLIPLKEIIDDKLLQEIFTLTQIQD